MSFHSSPIAVINSLRAESSIRSGNSHGTAKENDGFDIVDVAHLPFE